MMHDAGCEMQETEDGRQKTNKMGTETYFYEDYGVRIGENITSILKQF